MSDGESGFLATIIMAVSFLPVLFLLGSDKNDHMKTLFCILGPLAIFPYAVIVLLRLLTGRPLRGRE